MKKIINLVLVVFVLTTFHVSANNVTSFEEDLPKAVKAMSEMIKKKNILVNMIKLLGAVKGSLSRLTVKKA